MTIIWEKNIHLLKKLESNKRLFIFITIIFKSRKFFSDLLVKQQCILRTILKKVPSM